MRINVMRFKNQKLVPQFEVGENMIIINATVVMYDY